MYVCMYVCVYVWNTCIHVCMYEYMYGYRQTYVQTYIHTYIHTYKHTCIHVYMYACIYACIYACWKRTSMRLKKPLLFNCPPRHLHVVTLLRTKCAVDDRALAGISEIHEPRRMKDGWWKSPTLRDGVSLKTTGGRQRETTSLISQDTDDGTNKLLDWMMSEGYGKLKE